MKERDRLVAMRANMPGALPGEESARKKKKGKKDITASKSKLARRLSQAGISLTPKVYGLIIGTAALLLFYVSSFLGLLLSIVLSSFFSHFMCFGYLEERAQKRKGKIIPQLAPFIDAIASSLSSGLNIEAAIVTSAESVPPGLLRTELEKVISAINRGFSVREAMGVLRERIVGREITSLAVALTLFASMGGSVLEPFRRLARKLREQQTVADRAVRDLVMVKQAFYVLFFLAVSAPGILMLVRPGYMNQAFSDPLGRIVLQIGAIMIVIAYMVFKKITNLRV